MHPSIWRHQYSASQTLPLLRDLGTIQLPWPRGVSHRLKGLRGQSSGTAATASLSLATSTSTKVSPKLKTPSGTLVLRNQGLRSMTKIPALGSSKQLRAFISVPLPSIVTYRFPAIHGLHPEPPVLFRQCLHGDDSWPVEKGGHRYEPKATGRQILMKVKSSRNICTA